MTTEEKIPDYLYHYTTIDNLALILKNKTIRFNSLDKMDDLQEQESQDFKTACKLVFVSSWTDDETESIPMWNMYASLYNGVRIKLKSNPFQVYANKIINTSDNFIIKSEKINSFNNEDIVQVNGKLKRNLSNKSVYPHSIFSYVCIEEFFNNNYLIPNFLCCKNLLYKINYTDDQSKLRPTLKKVNGNSLEFNINELGFSKNNHWGFQKEWRYIFNVISTDVKAFFEKNELSSNYYDNIENDNFISPFEYYDLKISDKEFENMEITLSPCLTESKRELLNALLEKYKVSNIHESVLKNKIR
ncbi:DUF2971 domain-containing protein [Peptostreptococcus canis]|uniref:DUF2971 domain-containing protein n=1 Tax=Peptostreptococcus canis TaxID=1159213 RepID=A0ABR6TMZ5_9FIRM|nr:DUF2971 domain-containing protein [Peptostreptococcus canis]MBC2576593.1 DUF2971 domain-containing protein [Peptostreptococcus canis]MBP1998780.1 hypothetical protein [Peptostreptococcus canis]